MNDALLSFLGLAQKAGKLRIGFDTVKYAVINGQAKLVCLSRDLSSRSAGAMRRICEESQVQCVELNRTMDVVGSAVGKWAGVLSVNDAGFARKTEELCRLDNQGGRMQ